MGDGVGNAQLCGSRQLRRSAPLLLAPLALLDRGRRGIVLFFVLLAGLSLSFILGLPTYRLLFEFVPGVDQLRTPFRWVYAFDLALLVLAGIGLDGLLLGGRHHLDGLGPLRRAGRWIGLGAAGAGLLGAILILFAWLRPERWTAGIERLFGQILCGESFCALDAALQYFPDLQSFAAYQYWNFGHLAIFTLLSGIAIWFAARSKLAEERHVRADRPYTDRQDARRQDIDGRAEDPEDLASARRDHGRDLVHDLKSLFRGGRWIGAAPLAVLALDLLSLGYGFNPAVEAGLAHVEPPALIQLRSLAEAKWGRVTAFGPKRILWPNSAMRGPVSDIRAYDSIIPSWSAETMGAIEDQSGMLIYNRLANVQDLDSLGHPLMRALGVRYLLTDAPILAEGYAQIYADDDVLIYENRAAMRRAWVVEAVEVHAERADLLAALDDFEPERTVLLEEVPDRSIWKGMVAGRQIAASTQVKRDSERHHDFEIDVSGAPSGGMLVLSDAYFPGWRAWVEVAGGGGLPEAIEAGQAAYPSIVDPITGQIETEVPIYRANGMMRAIPVPPGRSTVRLKYVPNSIKLGLYLSFLGGILLLLGVAALLWQRFVRVQADDVAGRVAVNSAGPMAANLLSKLILMVFAMLATRVLGPADYGRYYLAITIIGFADILTNFGLNLLVTREVAKDHGQSGRYLGQTIWLRLGLWLLMLPLLGLYLSYRGRAGTGNALAPDTVKAVWLFALALIPSNLSAALSSIFQARERMVLPAAVSIVTTLVTVSVGALVILAGHGYVGLAWVAILSNLVTLLILAFLARGEGFGFGAIGRHFRPRPAFIWGMVALSLPLMLNHLLQTVFFKIDVLMLNQLVQRDADTVVGWYQSAYKWVDALLIIQAAFIMAIFPLMSRQAESDRAGLARGYAQAQRWLVTIALIVALVTTYAADDLVLLLAGREYVPQGATALKVMIWFLPLSFANGLAQYVLVALDRQRWITLSFVFAVAFNLLANWLIIPGREILGLAIPAYGYVGAATVTILSELVLRLPFAHGLRDLDGPPLLVMLWRPALAASAAALLLAGFDYAGSSLLLGIPLAVAIYLGALRALGWLEPEDRAILARFTRPRGARGRAERA